MAAERDREPSLEVARKPGRTAGVAAMPEVERQRFEALQYVTEVGLSRLSLDDLLRELLRRIRKVMASDNAAILLLTPDERYLVVRAADGVEEAVATEVRVPVGRGIAGGVAARREPMVVEDLSRVEVWNAILREKIRSLIAVPLMVQDRVIGVLHVDWAGPRRLGREDLELVQLVADRAAVAIDRTQAAEAESRLAAIVDSSEDSIIGKTLEGIITSWNPAAERLYGYTPEEAIGRSISIIFPPDHAEELAYILERVRRGERVEHYETVRQRKDGSRVEVLIAVSPIKDMDGQVVGAATTTHDITERKRAERALRLSEERFRVTFEQAAVGMAQVGLDGRWLRVNQKLSDIVGYTAAELTQKTFQEITLPEDLESDLEYLRRLLAGEISTYSMEKRYIRKDGSLVWVNLTVSMVQGASGEPESLISVVEDISRRKLVEEERQQLLEEIQRRAGELDATILSIVDGIVIYSPSGEIRRMNPAAEAMLGYSKANVAMSLEDRVRLMGIETAAGEPFPMSETPVARALQGEAVQGVVMVIRPPGEAPRWVSASAAPILVTGGEIFGAVASFTDITELHALQEQREDLVRMVSHDLRSPLTAVQGQAQLLVRLMERAGQDAQLRQGAESIFTSARRMNAMIEDLVDMSRLESRQLQLNPTAVDLAHYIGELGTRLKDVLGLDRVRVKIPSDFPPVRADPDRLERILTNLLSNALKYSSPETKVVLAARRSDAEAVVSVADQGAGIPAEDIPHISERFYRAKGTRKAEGLGLGLYITRMLVEAQGGRVWVESRVGKGSTFCFSLPLAG